MIGTIVVAIIIIFFIPIIVSLFYHRYHHQHYLHHNIISPSLKIFIVINKSKVLRNVAHNNLPGRAYLTPASNFHQLDLQGTTSTWALVIQTPIGTGGIDIPALA